MFDSVLVANRGEIARRVIRTVQRMGLRAIAVHSEADADLPFVTEADDAVLLGPAAPARSYLDVDKVIAAARSTGAQAVQPVAAGTREPVGALADAVWEAERIGYPVMVKTAGGGGGIGMGVAHDGRNLRVRACASTRATWPETPSHRSMIR
ncbi:hypothetical protein Pth03_72890 [Planotetraspora thailandica]|uniref:biotin carboxylase n=1 Tax=Planotetraspora thailandica TaxID=487172 RepID=A0A8J3Y191_9ACTN|nr:biotin carboxylase N-terminal domain-containing protein [Planotetraspora thailandica]GII58900.1 hypothetical protein Pth03_72890 [Planotetraspora thailandica]